MGVYRSLFKAPRTGALIRFYLRNSWWSFEPTYECALKWPASITLLTDRPGPRSLTWAVGWP
jgi:hypothetical protein